MLLSPPLNLLNKVTQLACKLREGSVCGDGVGGRGWGGVGGGVGGGGRRGEVIGAMRNRNRSQMSQTWSIISAPLTEHHKGNAMHLFKRSQEGPITRHKICDFGEGGNKMYLA